MPNVTIHKTYLGYTLMCDCRGGAFAIVTTMKRARQAKREHEANHADEQEVSDELADIFGH